MTTNQDTFGITALDLMRYLNSSFSDLGWRPEILLTGTSGVGGNLSWTDSTANWKPNSLIGWSLIIGTTFYSITANTRTVITTATNHTGTTGAYSVGTASYDLSDDDFTTELLRAISLVKGEIPERYRDMITRIKGDVIIEKASDDTTTASLSFPTNNDATLELYRNIDLSNYSKSLMLVKDTDYTIAAHQNITFTSELSIDCEITAFYFHDLVTVPALLKTLGLWKFFIEASDRNLILTNNNSLFNLEAIRTQYKDTIVGLNKGEIGISEFDYLRLKTETKSDTRSGIKSFCIGC